MSPLVYLDFLSLKPVEAGPKIIPKHFKFAVVIRRPSLSCLQDDPQAWDKNVEQSKREL